MLLLPDRYHILVVGHALKETLDVEHARDALRAAAVASGCVVAGDACVSDGGDGFLHAIKASMPTMQLEEAVVTGPHHLPVECEYGWDAATRTAVIEIARCSGLRLVPPTQRNVLRATSAGVGDLLHAFILRGATSVYVGLGGSATVDGGIGMLGRLAEFRLGAADWIHPAAANGAGAMHIKASTPPIMELRAALGHLQITAFTDVRSPLCGQSGAARVFGPQKGASPEQALELDRDLEKWAQRIIVQLPGNPALDLQPGAGAAGGLGFAFSALGGKIAQGAEEFLRLASIADKLAGADVLITCEGRFDLTSFEGKAPWIMAHFAAQQGKQACIVCGSCAPEAATKARALGVTIWPFSEVLPVDQRRKLAARQVQDAAARWLESVRSL